MTFKNSAFEMGAPMIKRQRILILFLFFLIIVSTFPHTSFVCSSSSIGTKILFPIADSYVDSDESDHNFGEEERLQVYYYKWMFITKQRFAYLMFNLSGIPAGINIVSADLRLFAESAQATLNIGAHYCSDNSWEETEITWNNKPSWSEETTDIEPVSVSNSWFNWNIKSDVERILQSNDTLLTVLLTPEETEDKDLTVVFYSRETELTEYRPKLVITYNKIQPSLSLYPIGHQQQYTAFPISGSFSPAQPGIVVNLTITDPDGIAVSEVTETDTEGKFSVSFEANKIGVWSVTANSEGNEFFEGATSNAIRFNIVEKEKTWIDFIYEYWWILLIVILIVIFLLIPF